MHAMGLELVLDARPLSPGNVSAHDMRVDRGRSAAERVRQAMEISDFLSGVVAAGQGERHR